MPALSWTATRASDREITFDDPLVILTVNAIAGPAISPGSFAVAVIFSWPTMLAVTFPPNCAVAVMGTAAAVLAAALGAVWWMFPAEVGGTAVVAGSSPVVVDPDVGRTEDRAAVAMEFDDVDDCGATVDGTTAMGADGCEAATDAVTGDAVVAGEVPAGAADGTVLELVPETAAAEPWDVAVAWLEVVQAAATTSRAPADIVAMSDRNRTRRGIDVPRARPLKCALIARRYPI